MTLPTAPKASQINYKAALQAWTEAARTAIEEKGAYPYVVYDNTGGQSYTQDTEMVVNLDKIGLPSDNYSLSGNVITIATAGTYWISYKILYTEVDTSGDARATIEGWVEDNSSGVFDETPGSFATGYIREATNGASVSASVPIVVAAGQKIRLKTQLTYAQPNCQTRTKSSLSIIKMSA